MWFEKLVGFPEGDRKGIYEKLVLEYTELRSKVNGRRFQIGVLEVPALDALRSSVDLTAYQASLDVKEIIADVQLLHIMYPGAVFQAASQFNLLEMVGPGISPEAGIDIYEHDFTQGPACAIACGAGTIFRNYFVPLGTQIGQTANRQIDCLEDLGAFLGNEESQYWEMRNGYALPTREGLQQVGETIRKLNSDDYIRLMGKLKVGIQWQTEVTIAEEGHTVTQVYCSALPIAYSSFLAKAWEPFARLILEATYEATFWAALKQFEINGNKKLFLTLVGAGAFGNPIDWVLDALKKSITKFKNTPLEVAIVSYQQPNPQLKSLLA